MERQDCLSQKKKNLEAILEGTVIKTSVGRIISELFQTRYKNFGYNKGDILHYKLGFMNSEKFCRYYDLSIFGLSNTYLLICGVPDRISYEDGKLYVDELKTTITGRDSLVKKIGEVQLQLYMFLTGINRGRLYIYYKDRDELKLVEVVEYDPETFNNIILRYVLMRSLAYTNA